MGLSPGWVSSTSSQRPPAPPPRLRVCCRLLAAACDAAWVPAVRRHRQPNPPSRHPEPRLPRRRIFPHRDAGRGWGSRREKEQSGDLPGTGREERLDRPRARASEASAMSTAAAPCASKEGGAWVVQIRATRGRGRAVASVVVLGVAARSGLSQFRIRLSR
jgi:hypothetical protein